MSFSNISFNFIDYFMEKLLGRIVFVMTLKQFRGSGSFSHSVFSGIFCLPDKSEFFYKKVWGKKGKKTIQRLLNTFLQRKTQRGCPIYLRMFSNAEFSNNLLMSCCHYCVASKDTGNTFKPILTLYCVSSKFLGNFMVKTLKKLRRFKKLDLVWWPWLPYIICTGCLVESFILWL